MRSVFYETIVMNTTATPITTQIPCQQCAAPLPVEQGTRFVKCEFCGATNFVDKARAVFHYALQQTVRDTDALAALRRWMAGNQTVKGLDAQAKIDAGQFEYFPMWLVRTEQNGVERLFLEPAAALSISALKGETIPAADLIPYDHELDAAAVEPTVPYDAMLQWLKDEQKMPDTAVKEVSLVHLPLFVFKYEFKGERYTAMVDAATSRVFANIFPTKWEAPYFTIASIAFIVYFCLAMGPLAGYMSGTGEGFALGVVAYIVLSVIVAIPIFVAAAYISAKV
jgi:LSD1 subclass zinc finger protein